MLKARRIYIIRHPQTKYNKENRFQGLCDSPITSEGLVSLKKTTAYFLDKSIELIYSSPLERCIQTAHAINEIIKTKLVLDDRLKEICYGEWEARTKEEIGFDTLQRERGKNRFTYVHPGWYNGIKGESYEMLYSRLLPFWEEVKKKSKGNVLVVGHVGVMIAAKKYFESINNEEIAEFRPKNMEVLDYEAV